MANLTINISYSQICVFDSSLQNPFNDWTDDHVSQGFSWRYNAVSFRTLEEFGIAEVEVVIKSHIDIKTNTVRAIQVPFTVPENGSIDVASIEDSKSLEINPGRYTLVFETGFDNYGNMWCSLSFVSAFSEEAKILKADDELNPPPTLVMTANPAC
ncbi:MAG: hypothetical protein JNJ50_25280 [Acidobacteria bacterium]|nr:hypothetical protein [Acidobacteriota bacterium]